MSTHATPRKEPEPHASTPKPQTTSPREVEPPSKPASEGKDPNRHLKSLEKQKEETKSKLSTIEREKKTIVEQIQKVDKQIEHIKVESLEREIGRKKSIEQVEKEAKRKAQAMVEHYRKENEERKKKKQEETEKVLRLLQKEQQNSQKEREEAQRVSKQRKRKEIQERMESEKKRLEERRSLEKESNKLILKLKKDEESLKKRLQTLPESLSPEKEEPPKKVENISKEIEEHQKRYKQVKDNFELKKKERSITISYQMPKYEKNCWADLIEKEEEKQKEEEKVRQLSKALGYQKRVKYGQKISESIRRKPYRPRTQLPEIQSDKRFNQNRRVKDMRDIRNGIASRSHQEKITNLERTPSQEMLQKNKKARQVSMRRQNKDRLKKWENRVYIEQKHHESVTTRPKYENYLGKLKLKRKNQSKQWQRVLGDSSLTIEQKYAEMMWRAGQLQSQARFKQQIHKNQEETVDLYISSIHAKLALLDQQPN